MRGSGIPGLGRLAAIALGALIVWLGILPSLGRQAAIRAAIDRCQAEGINPSALYYTEHEGYARWLDKAGSPRATTAAARPARRRPRFHSLFRFHSYR